MIPYKLHPSVSQHPRILAARSVCEILHAAGRQAWWVGGCVRDFLLEPEKPPKDIDISTDASFEEVQSKFPKTIAIGRAFGVGLVSLGEYGFEVSTFRKEAEYADRRHPNLISQGTIEEDSARRDFTVNALYFDPIEEVIVDFHDGLSDLNKRQIRCVGDSEVRLHEDPLRILRLHRFAANLNFSVEFKTQSVADALAGELVHISLERVLLEISKVSLSGFTSFAYRTRAAQWVLLQHTSLDSKVSSHLPHGSSTEPRFILPPEALLHPGTLFLLMSIKNFGNSAFDWLKVLKKWPLSLSEQAHSELAVRLMNLRFRMPQKESDTETTSTAWHDFLEQCRWLMRQSRTKVIDASWIIENLAAHKFDSDDILQSFCRICNAEYSHLSLAQAIEKTISDRCKIFRAQLNVWAKDKPQEALGWARLMTDVSVLLQHTGYDQKQLPNFMQHTSQHSNSLLCEQAEKWAERNRSAKKRSSPGATR